MNASHTQCQLRLRFVNGQAIALGPGKVELLEAIAVTGSISQAARKMNMSYRRAWLLINTMNQCFTSALVETVKGGEKGGGSMLTELGNEVVKRYRRIESKMLESAGVDIDLLQNLIL